jgi:hypothetical protein
MDWKTTGKDEIEQEERQLKELFNVSSTKWDSAIRDAYTINPTTHVALKVYMPFRSLVCRGFKDKACLYSAFFKLIGQVALL